MLWRVPGVHGKGATGSETSWLTYRNAFSEPLNEFEKLERLQYARKEEEDASPPISYAMPFSEIRPSGSTARNIDCSPPREAVALTRQSTVPNAGDVKKRRATSPLRNSIPHSLSPWSAQQAFTTSEVRIPLENQIAG